MTDQPQNARDTLAGRVFMAPATGGDWKRLGGITDVGPSLLPEANWGEKLSVPKPSDFTLEVQIAPDVSSFIDELHRTAVLAEAIIRSRALARAMELGVGVLAITEDYRTIYVVTDLIPPRQLCVAPVAHLAAFIERTRA